MIEDMQNQCAQLVKMIKDFIDDDLNEFAAEKFCDDYMELFYVSQNELSSQVQQEIYEIFDDINYLCDSYEPNVQIRKSDDYCIDEKTLKGKIFELYNKMCNLIAVDIVKYTKL